MLGIFVWRRRRARRAPCAPSFSAAKLDAAGMGGAAPAFGAGPKPPPPSEGGDGDGSLAAVYIRPPVDELPNPEEDAEEDALTTFPTRPPGGPPQGLESYLTAASEPSGARTTAHPDAMPPIAGAAGCTSAPAAAASSIAGGVDTFVVPPHASGASPGPELDTFLPGASAATPAAAAPGTPTRSQGQGDPARCERCLGQRYCHLPLLP